MIPQAPRPDSSRDFHFVFAFPFPIRFRGKTLQEAQITVVLRPAHLKLMNRQPERGSTLAELPGSINYEPVAWKVFTLTAQKEGKPVRLPKDLGFGDVEESDKGMLVIQRSSSNFFTFAPYPEDPNAAPRPTIEDDDDADDSDQRPKILSRGLIGGDGDGELVSNLKQRTTWHLVEDSQGLPTLKIVAHSITETSALLADKA
ncbi:hypothetical protein B0H12DRAFT_1244835 [Mycena haematopus]|nr:hypothetical protein B0H12DRAFT_1244835 [Mycena haematopus]